MIQVVLASFLKDSKNIVIFINGVFMIKKNFLEFFNISVFLLSPSHSFIILMPNCKHSWMNFINDFLIKLDYFVQLFLFTFQTLLQDIFIKFILQTSNFILGILNFLNILFTLFIKINLNILKLIYLMIDVLLRQKAVQTQEFALCRAKGFYLFLMSRAVNIVNIIQVDLNPLLLTAGSMLRGL